MANFDGLLSDSVLMPPRPAYITVSSESFTENSHPNSTELYASNVNLYGSRTFVDPLENNTEYNGLLFGAFSELYYNRIHVVPSKIDVGNLVNRQERQVEVWNAYFVQKNLTAILATTLDGTNLVGEEIYTFDALESKFYVLTVTLDGAPSFSGFYTFQFSDAEDPILTIEGKRVIVMPWIHNWDSGITERISYLTDVIEAKSGKEQRIQLRGRARRQYEYNILLRDARERIRYRNLMSGWQHRTFAIGIWSDILPLGADYLIGETIINIDTRFRDYEVGSYCMLWRNSLTYEIIEIEALTASSITLAQPLLNNWLKDAIILPARLAYVGDEIFKTVGITNSIETAPQVWNLLNSEASVNRNSALASPYTYLGYDVFIETHDYSEDYSAELYRPLRPIDFGIGNFQIDSRYAANRERQTMRLVFGSRANISAFMGFLEVRKGRKIPVWIPTFSPDMELIENIGDTATSFIITDIGYATFIAEHPTRNHLAFVKHDGTMIFRKIVDSADNGDGTESISIDTALGFNATPETFRYICFLRFCRMDSDSIEIAWDTSEIAQIQISFSDLMTSPV